MAQKKITELTALTSLSTDDLFLTVNDPAGTPASRKTTFSELVASIAAMLTGAHVAVGANVNVIGAVPVLHRIDITAGALADTDVTLTHKTRVIDAWLILRGAGVASTTLQVKNGTNAITNAMAASGADKALVRAAEIDDANHEIAAAGTLRVTSATGATQPAATVYVLGVRVS